MNIEGKTFGGVKMGVTMKDALVSCFNAAKANNSQFIAVVVRTKDYPEDEVIINRIENVDAKLEYYIMAYDDDMRLRYNKDIRIIGFTHADSFDEIQADLVD